MKKKLTIIMLALCLVGCLTLASVLAIAAQEFTDVATEEELAVAIRYGGGNVRLTDNITVESGTLPIDYTTEIDLNGHTLTFREPGDISVVRYINSGKEVTDTFPVGIAVNANLTLTDSDESKKGKIDVWGDDSTGIYVGPTGDLCMWGGTLTNSSVTIPDESEESPKYTTSIGIFILRGKVSMTSGSRIENESQAGVMVCGGEFSMAGGSTVISGCGIQSSYGSYYYGGGVRVSSEKDRNGNTVLGSFKLNMGARIENCSAFNGGGVYLSGHSVFTINAGSITGCKANQGGGVYVSSIGKVAVENGQYKCVTPAFTMKGGSIENCTASNGGGVYVDAFDTGPDLIKFEMNAGSIKNCSAINGGGVTVGINGTFTMSGSAAITVCKATGLSTFPNPEGYGGGVYMFPGSSINISGGSITGCQANAGSSICSHSAINNENKYNVTGGIVSMTVSLEYVSGTKVIRMEGLGTVTYPYNIGNKEQLLLFRDIVNGTNGQTQNLGACAMLINDIVLNDGTFDDDGNYTSDLIGATPEEWTPIGDSRNAYSGTFNGSGRTIKGLYYTGSNVDEYAFAAGLFDSLDGATVMNVTVTGYIRRGCNPNDGTKGMAGGIAGKVTNSTIRNCRSACRITTAPDRGFVGGIAGSIFGTTTIENCRNDGYITQYVGDNSAAGGIVGNMQGGTVKSCINTGKVDCLKSSYNEMGIGGIVGRAYAGTISDCINIGEVNVVLGTGYAGGIIGYTEGDDITIRSCYSVGTVTAANNIRMGGICGGIRSGSPTFKNCYCLDTSAFYSIGYRSDEEGSVEKRMISEFADGTVLALLKAGRTGKDDPWADECIYFAVVGKQLPALRGMTGDAHTHSYSEWASYGDAQHIRKCSCGAVEKAAHTIVNDVCTVCGYIPKHIHCICGGSTSVGDHTTHSDITWEPWTATDSLPTKAGNYFLLNDVTMKRGPYLSADIKLCLNGKTVTFEAGHLLASAFTLSDCKDGGVICGSDIMVVRVGGAFNMYGGSIVNTRTDGSENSCVEVGDDDRVFNLYGGTVGNDPDDYAIYFTGSVKISAVLNAYGGKVNGILYALNLGRNINFYDTEFRSLILIPKLAPYTGTPKFGAGGRFDYIYPITFENNGFFVLVTDSNKDDVFGDGTVKYEFIDNGTTKKGVLTLNNAHLKSTGGSGTIMPYGFYPEYRTYNCDLDIVLIGKNTIEETNGGYCIVLFEGYTLTFRGDGELEVTGNGTMALDGIVAATNIIVESGDISISSGNIGLSALDFTVNGGNVTIKGKKAAVATTLYYTTEYGKLTVNGGTLTLITTDAESGVAINGGTELPVIVIANDRTMLAGAKNDGSDLTVTGTSDKSIAAAKYIKILEKRITITCDPGKDGSGAASTVTKIYGTDLTLPGALFTRTGYTQTGWATTDGGAKVYELGGTYSANAAVTLYPVWTVNKYTISFDTDGGSEIASITQDYGTTVNAPANPTKVGYTFAGWDKEVPATMPAGNVTLKAKWTINKYTITFDTDGGSEIASITQNYGTTVTAPANPTKVGYTFAGWDKDIPATMPAENVTLKAKWTINKYTITFDTDGGSEIASITQDYGTTVTAPANPTKVGYTFAGWDKEVPATMPAENITLKANWKVCDHSGNKNALTCANDVTCSVCGATLAALAHTPEMDDLDCSTPVLCKVCGQVVTPGMRHSFGDRWYSDETTHWHFCSNGLCFVKSAISSHDWVDVPALAPTKTEDGYTAHRECTVCGAKCGYEVVPAHEIIRGDFDDNGVVDKKDAIYLLRHTIMGELYPLNQSGDMNGDGIVDKNDAVYLLRYTLLPKLYPLK